MIARLIDMRTGKPVGHPLTGDALLPGDVIHHGRGRRYLVHSTRIDPDATRVWVTRLT